MRRDVLRPTALTLVLAAAGLGLAAVPVAAKDRLALSEGGSGDPTIVLIHGIGSDRHVWDRVAATLERDHRVVRVDLPGHGETPAQRGVSVGRVAKRLNGSLKDLKIKNAILVGHSYGALVALEAAVAEPGRVAGIVAIDMATHLEADSAQIAELERLVDERPRVFVEAMYRNMTRTPELADSLVAHAARVPRDVLGAYFRDAWHADLRPRIKSLRAPIQFIGTEAIWPSAESWTSARRRLGYETRGPAVGRRIMESRHFIPIDAPDSLAQAILDFAGTRSR